MASELIIYPDGTTYRRSGECDGCLVDDVRHADCCRYVQVPDRPLSQDELHWLQLHGLTATVQRNVRIEAECSGLVDGRCKFIGSFLRPALCENYPEQPGLDARCSYTFERLSA